MFGIIGCGNMGGAILNGVVKASILPPKQIFIFDADNEKCTMYRNTLGVQIAAGNTDLCKKCSYVLLAVKPVYMDAVLQEIKPFCAGKKIISIAAGITKDHLEKAFEGIDDVEIVRVMPNTPALVGSGFTCLCSDNTFSPESLAFAKKVFDSVGEVCMLPERLFDGIIALSGSGPAYVYMMIQAMADGAVLLGIDRKTAERGAAATVLGAAKMALETGKHPAQLKDDVCSPGGTTIEAVYQLEKNGFQAAVMQCMKACADKSREMSEKAVGGK